MTTEVTSADLPHLRRCVELATEAVAAGDFPFGSVLAAADGTVLAEERNREVTTGDPTRHPEFALARCAAANMTPRERATAVRGHLPVPRRGQMVAHWDVVQEEVPAQQATSGLPMFPTPQPTLHDPPAQHLTRTVAKAGIEGGE